MTDVAGLGAFLRARRAAADPEQPGLPATLNRRRVPGLRREEVAQLAGISVDYYMRLEQGRATGASPSVLNALAQAFRLDADETRYLHLLAAPPRPARSRTAAQQVRPQLLRLLETLHGPAVVYGRYAEVLAWNRLGGVLYTDVDAPFAERNAARGLFLDPRKRDVFPEFELIAADMVANLRAESGRHPHDPVLAELVDDLSARSTVFRDLWSSHVVHERAHGTKLVRNAVVGMLTLHYETFRLPDDPDQSVVAYAAAEAGSSTDQALDLLASWVATAPARAAESQR